MSTPSAPRLSGDTAADLLSITRYMGDIYQALVAGGQLPVRLARIAAVDLSALPATIPHAAGATPTAAEFNALADGLNAGLAVLRAIIAAAKIQ